MTEMVLSMFAESTLLALLAFAFGFLFRHRPATAHWIWLVVLLKFALPPLPEYRPVVELPMARSVNVSTPDIGGVVAPFRPPPRSKDASSKPQVQPSNSPKPAQAQTTSSRIPAAAPSAALSRWNAPSIWRSVPNVMLGIWITGSLIWLVRGLLLLVKFHRSISRGSSPPDWLIEEVQQQSRSLGIRAPRIVVCSEVSSPLVFCLGPLTLVWPKSLVDANLRNVARRMIVHELAHIRRRDHWSEWLAFLLSNVWWWNPVFWLVRRELVRTADLCCDGWVLKLAPSAKREYAESLIALSERTSPPAVAPAMGLFAGSRRFFKRRIEMIMKNRVTPKCSRLTIPLIIFVMGFAMLRWNTTSVADDAVTPIRNSRKVTAARKATTASKPVRKPKSTDKLATRTTSDDDFGFGFENPDGSQPRSTTTSTTQVIRLDHAKPNAVASLLDVLKAMNDLPPHLEDLKIVSDPPSRTLIVRGSKDGVETLAAMVERFDDTVTQNTSSLGTLRFFAIETRSPSDIASILRKLELPIQILHPADGTSEPSAVENFKPDDLFDAPATTKPKKTAGVHLAIQKLLEDANSGLDAKTHLILAGETLELDEVAKLLAELGVLSKSKNTGANEINDFDFH